MNIALKKIFNEKIPKNIYTYDHFMKLSEEIIASTNVENLSEKEKIYHNYRKLNLQRTNRINKTFKPDEEIEEQIEKIDSPQFWNVITEDWCGDSAQNLPYIVNYIKNNSFIDLKIILRDESLEAIDNYITEGNPRSIPKILAFDKDGNEIFMWGPRPKIAQDLVSQLKAEGYTKEEFNKDLHLWYARNRGKELEKEFKILLNGII